MSPGGGAHRLSATIKAKRAGSGDVTVASSISREVT
jgi:hypothetical protein